MIIVYKKTFQVYVPVELITILVDEIEQHLLCSAMYAGAFASELVTLVSLVSKSASSNQYGSCLGSSKNLLKIKIEHHKQIWLAQIGETLGTPKKKVYFSKRC